MKKIALVLIALIALSCNSKAQEDKKERTFPVSKSNEEWKEILTSDEYYILREAGTERPFTSELLEVKKPGTFVCAACETPLYKTKHKFDSGTGWPSFDRAVDGNVVTDTDYKIGYARTELLCATCGGHLGHVFDDGPKETTGKRHCINGDALDFKPQKG
ncbi:hypothetical protein GCM10009117_13690 [Gangjinia marincola]|uniref:peptide-methionine (R)-S-oxide reductase n=1 Tax=Gangjinia marincola TaxID=578463 RepID=A0ABN1MGK0_9FLAO